MAPSPESNDKNDKGDKNGKGDKSDQGDRSGKSDNVDRSDKTKDKDSSAPPPSSKSSSPSPSPPSPSPSPSKPSAPPPSESSPPPTEKSPPPPKPPPPSPSPPPSSPPPSPPPKSEEAPPTPKSSPSPPPPASKGSPPPPTEEESPPNEDAPTPPATSSKHSSPAKHPPSSKDEGSSPSPPSPESNTDAPSPPPPPPFSSPSATSQLSAPPTPSATPLTSATPTTSSPSRPSPSGSSTPSESSPPGSGSPNLTLHSIVQTPGNGQDQAIRIGIALGVVAAVLMICFAVGFFFVRRQRRKRNTYDSMLMVPSAFASTPDSGSSPRPSPRTGGDHIHSSPENAGIGNSKTWFTYEELASATDGFDSKNIIGAGGFGCVYKGFLQDGREVAIKKLKDQSGQGDREFRAEVEIISRVHHRHLVSLVGYCINDCQRLLVYEFVPNNTLYHHLHDPKKPPMIWAIRVRVACGSARGIAYLHEDCNPRIIHRDIKSANILLANNFEAKVADFGLAKLAQELESNTHVSTRVMGTFGYMAPEYATSGKLTEKSDVFSFGVVLLELITGHKSVDDSRPLGDESLVEWARPLMTEALESQNFDELADPRLEGNYDRGEMFRMIEAAAACVRHSASKRPRMSQVVRALDTMGDLSNGIKPGESEIVDSREQSAQIRMFQRMTFESGEYSSENFTSQSWTSDGTAPSGQIGGQSGQI